MKKTILTLTASLLFGAAAVFAQDTTRTDQQRDKQTQQDKYRTEGMVEVQEADLPEAVVTALEGSQYEGWRDGKVYLDPESGEYVVVLEKSGEASKEFRLDRSGTDVTERSKENQGKQNQDPMNQETDTAAQQQQGQDDQYRRDDQQQNDQQNQNDDAVQTDSTQQNQNEDATQTDTTAQDQNQNKDQQYRTEETDTTQVNQEGQINQQNKNEQDTAQNAEAQGQNQDAQGDQSVTEREEGDETETAYRKDDESRKAGHMEGQYKVIDVKEVPQAVVTTLDGSTYEGWKDNAVYVDTKTGDYIVQAQAQAGEEGMYYRLDKEGKDISKHKKDHKDMDKSKDETSKDKSKTDKSKDDY